MLTRTLWVPKIPRQLAVRWLTSTQHLLTLPHRNRPSCSLNFANSPHNSVLKRSVFIANSTVAFTAANPASNLTSIHIPAVVFRPDHPLDRWQLPPTAFEVLSFTAAFSFCLSTIHFWQPSTTCFTVSRCSHLHISDSSAPRACKYDVM